MAGAASGSKFDHVVSVMFENRSFDNLAHDYVLDRQPRIWPGLVTHPT